MGRRFGSQILVGLLMVGMLIGVGVYTYDLGVARGVVDAGQSIAAPGSGVPAVAVWPRPWGFGFGFFPFFPLLFILFWVFAVRGLFWRRGWRGGACGYGGVPP